MYDCIVVGGGVIGGTVLRELSKYKLRVVLTEKENDGIKLSEAECAEYIRLVDELHDLDVEIPFGIEI